MWHRVAYKMAVLLYYKQFVHYIAPFQFNEKRISYRRFFFYVYFYIKVVLSDMKLNEKQEKFVLEYAKSGNAGAAYRKAGYKVKDDNSAISGASRLLMNANVKERLQELNEEVKNDSIASIQEIKEFWTKVLRNEEVEEVVGMTEGGPFRLSKDCNIKDRIKAAELLGRTSGIFVDNVNVTGNTQIQFVDDLED